VTELPAHVRNLLAELHDLKAAGGNPIDVLLSSLPADMARRLRLCAIPHTFSPPLLAAIEPELSETEAEAKCAELADLAVVRRLADRFALHDEARLYLFRGWLAGGDPEFRAVSGRLAEYFSRGAAQLSENQAAAEEAQLRMVFHRLGVDEQRGMAEFVDTARALRYNLRPAARERLLALVEEYTSVLSPASLSTIQYERGKLAADLRQWDKAQKLFQDLLVREDSSQSRKARVQARLGMVAAARRDWDLAITHLEAARRIIGESDNRLAGMAERDVIVARILIGLGSAWREKRDYAKAKAFLEDGMSLARQSGNLYVQAHAYNTRGRFYATTDEGERAISDYRESLALLERAGDTLGVADVLNNIGIEYLKSSSNWQESREFFERSLRIKEEAEDAAGQATVLNNIANLERRAKAERRAIERFERAARLFAEVHDYFNAGIAMRNLARCHRSIDQVEAFKQRLGDARQFFERAGDTREIANIDGELLGLKRPWGCMIAVAITLVIFIVGVIALASLED
jgi:tetratricopeptide (TPR) repeat protein